MTKHKNYFILLIVVFTCIFIFKQDVYAKTIYVDKNNPTARDSNEGTKQSPLKSIQESFNIAEPNDTIYIKSGTYELDGFQYHIDFPLSIKGQNTSKTTIKNGYTFYVGAPLTVKDLTFEKFQKPVFYITSFNNNIVNDINFDNCTFKNTPTGIRTLSSLEGIKNVKITNCRFLNMSGDRVTAIRFSHGNTNNINISKNTFQDLKASSKGAIAIKIGDNKILNRTKNIKINNNTINNIRGVVQENVETKGILVFGSDIEISYNKISELNEGQDHEAIYIKGKNSIIKNNILSNVGNGAGGGDIAIKGKGSRNNQILENVIISELRGRAILVSGSAVIQSNYIKKPDSSGILIYPKKLELKVKKNYVYSNGTSIYIIGGLNANVANNHLVSLNSLGVKLDKSENNVLTNNRECIGSDCSVPEIPDHLLPVFPRDITAQIINN